MSLYEPIFRALEEREVRYVVVGGIAVILHGYLRFTVDLDLVVDLHPSEARKAVEVLTDFGFRPRLPVDPMGFADPGERRRWIEERNMLVFSMWHPSTPQLEVDLFVEHPIPFEELWDRSVLVSLRTTGARIASKGDLIEMKSGTGRHRDQEDVEALEQLDGEHG